MHDTASLYIIIANSAAFAAGKFQLSVDSILHWKFHIGLSASQPDFPDGNILKMNFCMAIFCE